MSESFKVKGKLQKAFGKTLPGMMYPRELFLKELEKYVEQMELTKEMAEKILSEHEKGNS